MGTSRFSCCESLQVFNNPKGNNLTQLWTGNGIRNDVYRYFVTLGCHSHEIHTISSSVVPSLYNYLHFIYNIIDAIDLTQNANCDVCALFTPPIKVTSMWCIWKPTTSCSAGPSDALAPPMLCQNHPAQTDRNENNIRKLHANAAAACRTGSARRCWVCCHSWNQWRQIRGNSPLRRLRVLQTDMTAQVCKAPQCCVTSGILL